MYGNLVYVRVRVNGSEPLKFILDSGAGISVINRDRAAALNLQLIEAGERSNFGGGEGKTRIAIAKNISFALGEVQFSVGQVLAVPIDDVESAVGGPVFGILGYELFTRYVVEVDYAAKIVKLHEPKNFSFSGDGETLPLKIKDNVPFGQGRLTFSGQDSVESDFLIDTGSNTVLTLNRPLVEKYKLIQPGQAVPALTGGVGGEFRAALGRLPAFQIGKVEFKDFPVIFSQATRGFNSREDCLGTIGGAILSRFKIVFDYGHKHMIVQPVATLTPPFKQNMSGAVLIATGKDFRTIKVQKILENTPAAEAGLREGDVINGIKGKPVADFDLEQIRQMLSEPDQELDLSVERGNQTLHIMIKTRKWF